MQLSKGIVGAPGRNLGDYVTRADLKLLEVGWDKDGLPLALSLPAGLHDVPGSQFSNPALPNQTESLGLQPSVNQCLSSGALPVSWAHSTELLPGQHRKGKS